eukprot:CAMPEP_0114665772 /NCGR_PEP_ID=MMETSP0191-20121206/31389_1 /TAXON_ID=126664 /ORGANISM="Sorites sp." /LENGTH=183 /DNA_ID=CAMNT_0001911743 /DNA_START=13 /DNA_END=564 /DNA_ORIENTATION=-
MSATWSKRLVRDLRRLEQNPLNGISASPYENDIMQWKAVIIGPDASIFEGGTFNLSLQFTKDYPNEPPRVKFITKLYHPNIYENGSICLDILQNQWSPIYDIGAILTSIQSLLTDPNPDSPANTEAAKMYQNDRREYEQRVRMCVARSWDINSDDDSDDDITNNDSDIDDIKSKKKDRKNYHE